MGMHASREPLCLLITCHHIAIPVVVTTIVGKMGRHCTSTLPKTLLLLDHYNVQLWLKSPIGQLGHPRQDLHEPEMRTFHHTQTIHARDLLHCLGNNAQDQHVFSFSDLIFALPFVLVHHCLDVAALSCPVRSHNTFLTSRHDTTCITQNSSSSSDPSSFTASCT